MTVIKRVNFRVYDRDYTNPEMLEHVCTYGIANMIRGTCGSCPLEHFIECENTCLVQRPRHRLIALPIVAAVRQIQSKYIFDI